MCVMSSQLLQGFDVHVLSVYEVSLNVAAPHTPDGLQGATLSCTVWLVASPCQTLLSALHLVTSHHQTPLSALHLVTSPHQTPLSAIQPGASDGFCTGISCVIMSFIPNTHTLPASAGLVGPILLSTVYVRCNTRSLPCEPSHLPNVKGAFFSGRFVSVSECCRDRRAKMLLVGGWAAAGVLSFLFWF
ncbi:hypothetical protein GDO78_023146 [Eleutherodactylus coqui]|uniref:Uncharacterized protein n=1 Tax=Eleutherodactylus coqui TaxID=57060 RepID=A0A8J6EFL0_ELECQ|nr:hypothetical protein GDO78_023146 [Eleutherodactylus coqui]